MYVNAEASRSQRREVTSPGASSHSCRGLVVGAVFRVALFRLSATRPLISALLRCARRRLQLSDALQEQGWRKKTVRLSDNSPPKRYVRADVVGVVATTPNRTVGGHRVPVSQCENPEKPLNHRKNTHSISDTETPVVATTPTTQRPHRPQDDHKTTTTDPAEETHALRRTMARNGTSGICAETGRYIGQCPCASCAAQRAEM